MDNKRSIESPIGALTVTSNGDALTRLDWGRSYEQSDDPTLLEACAQLDAYFAGTLRDFDLPFAGFQSDFAKRFGAAMCAIPFGETKTYGQLAREMDVSAQAIGQACGANRIPIIIPCHRVLAAETLGGYSGRGGIESKVWLLKHEGGGALLI